ncbi:MAG TPA: hypothetical protein VF595_05030 [Tepidisphaeraceae bacterium]
MKTTKFDEVIRLLTNGGVDFVLIGGLAANAHGSARITFDMDIVYSRAPDNLTRIADALAPILPYPRGAPLGLPFRADAETLRCGLNFTFDTTLGPVDILGEASGGGTYDELIKTAPLATMYDCEVRYASLDALIRMKTAAGRPKDFETIAELEALRLDAKRPLDET